MTTAKKLPRHLLPQIPEEKMKEFIKFMEAQGIKASVVAEPVGKLRAIQSHVNREKVESLKKNPKLKEKPIVISKGGWILDGHHRWLALKELEPNGEIACIKFECPINKLVVAGHKFGPSFTKSVYESTTYSKLLWRECRYEKDCRSPNCVQPDGSIPECKDDDDDSANSSLMVRKTLRPY